MNHLMVLTPKIVIIIKQALKKITPNGSGGILKLLLREGACRSQDVTDDCHGNLWFL